ncbi:Pre-mRNA-splicing factor prp5 [Merluccius polli]|uniref:Pre-mRNA-splicing factor prp5 n=1 Tax=Merluccius polli TaxID=89951 RepID=A0AA47LYX3_MERPO|nr:Pre-mRNA-splicing factor prp5 [Merluccius polli]
MDKERDSQRETLCLAVSPAGAKAATGGSDSTVRLYDLHTHQSILTCQARTVMDGHRSRVFAVTFHPERETEFISAGWDNTIQFWDSRQEQAVRRIWGPHVCGEALHVDAAKNQILSGSCRTHDSLEVWDYGSGLKVCDVSDPQQDSKIYTCHWLGESHMIAGGQANTPAGGQDNTLAVINRNSLQTEGRLGGLGSPVFSSSVCVCGKRSGLIAVSSGTSVYLLDHHK